jgi:hypothetical protein
VNLATPQVFNCTFNFHGAPGPRTSFVRSECLIDNYAYTESANISREMVRSSRHFRFIDLQHLSQVSYRSGGKYCRSCEYYFFTERLFCECCGMRLRANPHRGRVYKEKVRAKKKLIAVAGPGGD